MLAQSKDATPEQVASAREHIICVDDEVGILNALRQQLAPFQDTCDIDLAQSGSQALELMDELDADGEPVAMVIADQIMPGMKGVELLERVHERYPQTIKILLTGEAAPDAVVYAINHAGLARYIPKPWDEPDLRLTVESLLAKYRLTRENDRLIDDLKSKNQELKRLNRSLEKRVRARTSELAAVNQRLSQLAITDGLTGLYNHRFFHERLSLEIERSGRTRLPLSLLMADVDHFKRYNDTYGHPAGDRVLARVAELLSEGRRANDIVARYGGEEFTVLLPDTPRASAAALAEQLRQRIADHHFPGAQPHDEVEEDGHASRPGSIDDDSHYITISIGVAGCPDDATDPNELLLAADSALYRAKRGGRNRVELADKSATRDRRSPTRESAKV